MPVYDPPRARRRRRGDGAFPGVGATLPDPSRRPASGAGFTLLELLVVLVILGLLAGLVGPQALRYLGGAKADAAKLQVEEFGSGLDLFHLEVGRYPRTEEGLMALVEQPPGVANWNGPYLKKKRVPKDPWGNDYIYRSPGQNGPYDLLSLGADGAEGGEGDNQDVVSW
jgi:general secretion pathway protein G